MNLYENHRKFRRSDLQNDLTDISYKNDLFIYVANSDFTVNCPRLKTNGNPV